MGTDATHSRLWPGSCAGRSATRPAADDWVRRWGVGGRRAVGLVASLLILPVAGAIDAQRLTLVMTAVPLYFALSGIVTACGFSSILDAIPNSQRGFAMAVSFFLNVAVGAGLGPT